MKNFTQHKINALVNKINKDVTQMLQSKYQISYTEFLILFAIKQIPNCSQKDITEFSGLSKGMISRLIDRLSNSGKIKISEAKEDKRFDKLTINTNYSKKIDKISQEIDINFHDKYFDEFSDNEIAHLDKLLSKMLINSFKKNE
jgi:DNA-binding MarR family transcriptional regulator